MNANLKYVTSIRLKRLIRTVFAQSDGRRYYVGSHTHCRYYRTGDNG